MMKVVLACGAGHNCRPLPTLDSAASSAPFSFLVLFGHCPIYVSPFVYFFYLTQHSNSAGDPKLSRQRLFRWTRGSELY